MSDVVFSPADVGASPDIIAQALPLELSPIKPRSPYSWEQDDSYDPNEDLLERFMVNMGPGVGTTRTSPGVLNVPLAGAGTALRASTPATAAAGVGSRTFNMQNLPGRATTPPGQGYLSRAARGKCPTVVQKQPRCVPHQNTSSTLSDAGSLRRSSTSGGRRRRRRRRWR